MLINAPEEIFHHILVPLNAGVPQWGLADLQLLFFRPNDLSLYWTNTYSHHHLFFLGDNGGLSSTVDEEVDDVKEPETETKMSRVTIIEDRLVAPKRCSAVQILQFFKNIFTFVYSQNRGG